MAPLLLLKLAPLLLLVASGCVEIDGAYDEESGELKNEGGQCTDGEAQLNVEAFPRCCSGKAGRAHCAPAQMVTAQQQKDLASCGMKDGSAGHCVPDKFLTRGGAYTPKKCLSIGGREGRCLSVCVPSVQKDLASLPQASCDADERCAPCYDPRTGMGTGACTVGACDEGPSEPPKMFEPCGPGGSKTHLCVPGTQVPIGERCNFDNKGCNTTKCKEPGTLCVPKKLVEAGPTFTPKKCTNSLTGFLALFQTVFKDPLKALAALNEYKEGRCLSKCLPKIQPKANLLGVGKNGCDAEEVCVPCFDPEKIKDGKVPTGACIRPSCPLPK